MTVNDPILPVETLSIANLKAHPRNYRGHPEDQIEHLRASIRENGMYRNVVIASDGTILAGHGITTAATAEGLSEVPCIRMPFGPDDPAALKILVGDNELGLRAEPDDRALSMILKDLRDADPTAGLTGTGYDDAMLASLLFVTRDAVATFLDEDYMTMVVDRLTEKAATPITDPAKAVEFIGSQLRYTEEQRAGILDHFIKGGQVTAGGFMQAVTSFAQTVADPDASFELEMSAMDALELAVA